MSRVFSYTVRGHGTELLTAFTEGDTSDLATGTGTYNDAIHTGDITQATIITASKFEVRVPLPESLAIGSLLTAKTVGSTSEFSPTILVGDIVGSLAPIITLPSTASVVTGEVLSVSGSFVDYDSFSWTATVDYGSVPQPL